MRVRTNCDFVSKSEFTDYCWTKVLFLTVKNPFTCQISNAVVLWYIYSNCQVVVIS